VAPKAPPLSAAPTVANVPPVAALPKAVAPPVPEILAPEPSPALQRRLKVMVLYNEQTTPYLQPAHETLLTNILKAVGLTLKDIELVNLNNIRRVDYAEILREKTLHQLISFGIDLRELQLNIPLTAYQVQKVEDIQMLLADSFHELQLNTDKKRLLWTCLKQMFLK
jgi:DNA polymerase III psi subunit